jgi:hypothetical protein
MLGWVSDHGGNVSPGQAGIDVHEITREVRESNMAVARWESQ